jgi:hypothetical protein
LGLQNKLKPNLGQGTIELLPELFTIIPGNHDVSVKPSWFRRQKAEASRLKLFIETFGSTLNLTNHSNIYDFQEAFPTYKKLFDVVQVFSTNTTVDIPVHIVGFNASGEIGEQQRKRLFDKLNDLRDEHSYRIVLCHHHPLIIPYRLGSDIAEKFRALRCPLKLSGLSPHARRPKHNPKRSALARVWAEGVRSAAKRAAAARPVPPASLCPAGMSRPSG